MFDPYGTLKEYIVPSNQNAAHAIRARAEHVLRTWYGSFQGMVPTMARVKREEVQSDGSTTLRKILAMILAFLSVSKPGETAGRIRMLLAELGSFSIKGAYPQDEDPVKVVSTIPCDRTALTVFLNLLDRKTVEEQKVENHFFKRDPQTPIEVRNQKGLAVNRATVDGIPLGLMGKDGTITGLRLQYFAIEFPFPPQVGKEIVLLETFTATQYLEHVRGQLEALLAINENSS